MHKGGQINNVQLITGVRIAEMSQLQSCSVMCSKNGSYCEKRESLGGGGGVGWGCQDGCEWRSEAFVKIQIIIFFFFFFLGGGGGVGLGVGLRVGLGGGGQVDVNGEVKLLKLLKNSKKKNIFFFLGGGGGGGGGRGGGGVGFWGGGVRWM